jgi:transcription elongation factor GreA
MEKEKIYLTQKGLERIKKDYQRLLNQKKELLNTQSPQVLHSEDLDSEYLVFLQELEILEGRIKEYERILRSCEVIKIPPKEKQKEIHLGAKVLVEVNGQEDEFEIVDSIEADPAQGKISFKSPVGSALLGKKEGDEVVIFSPVKRVYKIKKVNYRLS